MVEDINATSKEWNLLGFLDSHPGVKGKKLLGYPVLGGFEDASRFNGCHFVVAFGDAHVRQRVVEAVGHCRPKWATLIARDVAVHPSNRLGEGVVITRNAEMTVECTLRNHVMLNVHCVVGHGVVIGDYSIVSPNVTINGGARIGKSCTIGANAFIRDVCIGDRVTVGASACVVRDVDSDCVVAGVPARVIRQGRPVHSTTKTEREKS